MLSEHLEKGVYIYKLSYFYDCSESCGMSWYCGWEEAAVESKTANSGP